VKVIGTSGPAIALATRLEHCMTGSPLSSFAAVFNFRRSSSLNPPQIPPKKDQVRDQKPAMTENLHSSRIGVGIALALSTLAVATFASRAAPQPIAVSAYSSLAARNCWIDGPGRVEDSPTRVCRGKATLVVLVSKDDKRETVSVGRNRDEAAKEPAAQTFFGPFNSALPSIEWRITGNNPFAMIQRWQIADIVDQTNGGGSDIKPLLVVSRLPPGAVCPVAYVDAAANPNADEMARQAADQVARDFKCGSDQAKVLGTPGRAAELAKPR
jgi:hypothetical protein